MFARLILAAAFILLSARSPETNAQTIFKTYTTLSGFYDYQTNNTCQYIRVNPANGRIHVIYLVALDSTNIGTSRRTVYAMSTNDGASWNNFNNITIGNRRSGFPSFDLLRGANTGLPVVVYTGFIGLGPGIQVFVDSPEGSGAFSELNAPPTLGTDDPINPDVAGLADGSIALVGTRSTFCGTYFTRTNDFSAWSPWQPILFTCSSRYVIEGNNNGRAALVSVTADSMKLVESANNGSTWRDTTIISSPIVMGTDTFAIWGSIDFAYLNNEPVVVMALQKINRPLSNDGAAIGFWSRATSVVLAVPRNAVQGIVDSLTRPQSRHLSMGYPVIGISGQYIVVGFQAFMRDTSAHGFNYSDVFWTFSIDGGRNWFHPENLTNTQLLDERYPSISRWNHGGPSMVEANMVWQEDSEPGSHITDGATVSRSKQVFSRRSIIWNSAAENDQQPYEFSLRQNYPNPFNPTTEIRYQISEVSRVTLKVFDVLGREVATLVNEAKAPGKYEIQFDASNLSSGVYYYQLRAGSFVATKKMLLIR